MYKGFFLIFINLVFIANLSATTLNSSGPTLLPPDKQTFRQASDPIRILFPAIAQHATSGVALALEIDSIDISDMVNIDGEELVFVPPVPLSLGKHELRLVEYAQDGDIVELGNWVFEVRQSAAFREHQLNVNGAINNTYRVADDYSGVDAEREKYHADGAAAVAYSASNENTAIHFTADLIYNEEEENSITGNQVDLGEYLLGVDIGENTHVDIGHHSVEHSSLIYNQFYRRGVSGRFALPSLNSQLQIFSTRTGDLQGFTQGFGVEDSDNRLSGAVFDYQPFSNNPEALTISTSYLSGKRKDNDDTMGLLVEESEGDAGSFAIDSQLFDQTLRIRVEAAQSEYDFDGSQGFDKERDTAYQLFTSYIPQPSGQSEFPLLWDISLEKTVVNPDFYSLANTSLVADKDFTQLTGNFSKAQWSTQLFINHEEDNLDDRFALTNNADQVGAVFRYASLADTPSSLWGTPQHTLSYIHTKNDQDTSGADITNDNKVEYLEWLSEFAYEKGHWLLLLSEDKFSDNLSPQFSTTTQRYELSAEYSLDAYRIATASVSFEDTEERESQLNSVLTNYLLGFDYTLPSQTLRGSFSLNYQEIDDEISTEENTVLTVSTSVTKQLLEAKDLFPGIDLALGGHYQQTDDKTNADSDEDTYAVFLNLNFYWDVNRPQPVEGE